MAAKKPNEGGPGNRGGQGSGRGGSNQGTGAKRAQSKEPAKYSMKDNTNKRDQKPTESPNKVTKKMTPPKKKRNIPAPLIGISEAAVHKGKADQEYQQPLITSLINFDELHPSRKYQNGEIFYSFTVAIDHKQKEIMHGEEDYRFVVIHRGRERHIHGKYRYHVVIARFPDHCISLPIFSYRGRGLLNKPRMLHAYHIALDFVLNPKDHVYQPHQNEGKTEETKSPTRTSPRTPKASPKTESPKKAKAEANDINTKDNPDRETKKAPSAPASQARTLNPEIEDYSHLTMYGRLSALLHQQFRDVPLDKNSLVDISKPYAFHYDFPSVPFARLDAKSLERVRELYIEAVDFHTELRAVEGHP